MARPGLLSISLLAWLLLVSPAAAQDDPLSPPPGAETQPAAPPAPAPTEPPPVPPVAPSLTAVTSKVQIKLYGQFTTVATWTDQGVNNHDMPSWAIEGTPDDEGGFEINVFQSRLGLDLVGPDLWIFDTEGKLELDFFGGGRDGNFSPNIRVRHAYAALRHDHVDILAGNTTALFMPLFPVSATHVALVPFMDSGELWIRLPQFQVALHTAPSSALFAALRFSINRPLGDQLGREYDANGIGAAEASKIPYLMANAEVTYGLGGKRKLSLILSGHWGVEDYRARNINQPGFDERLRTYGVGASAIIQPLDLFAIAGEVWYGKNLNEFFGGIRQGTVIVDGHRRSVLARGGWVQLQVFPHALFQVNVGYGIDDPNDGGLPGNERSLNQTAHAALWFKPDPMLTLAVEYFYIATDYHQTRDAYANQVAFSAIFAF